MRSSAARSTAGWLIFAALIIWMDWAAVGWVAKARLHMEAGVGGGPLTAITSYHHMLDGSAVRIVRNAVAGTRTVTIIRPATTEGLCRVWWPAVAGVILTLLALAFAGTRTGRWLIVESPLPRMTTRRWMIAVAVLGIEGGLVIGPMRDSGVDPLYARWTPVLIYLMVLHALAFTPAALALLYRYTRRERPDCLLGIDSARQ